MKLSRSWIATAATVSGVCALEASYDYVSERQTPLREKPARPPACLQS